MMERGDINKSQHNCYRNYNYRIKWIEIHMNCKIYGINL